MSLGVNNGSAVETPCPTLLAAQGVANLVGQAVSPAGPPGTWNLTLGAGKYLAGKMLPLNVNRRQAGQLCRLLPYFTIAMKLAAS
jgi:hypothetical protein